MIFDLQAGLTVALAGLASTTAVAAMLVSGRAGPLDTPNGRSLHTRPIPRGGGLGILLAVTIGMLGTEAPLWLACSVFLVAIVSWQDDHDFLPVFVRLACHFAAALIVAWGGGLPAAAWWVSAIMVFGIAWMTNLYNFMDGADGLAGGMSLFGFGTLSIAAWAAGNADIAILTGCIAAGVAGFLPFNFHPARIFLGDVGSIPLGFLAAVLGFAGVQRDLWPLWFPLLVFSPFIVDASITLARRILRGEKFWLAHCEHYYQRLVRLGWSHRRMALAEYVLMAAMAALALLLRTAPAMFQAAGVALAAVLYLVLAIAVDHAWRHRAAEEALAD
jgi:UDP-N-acetylmuramyl pentapeptide phosphotransferase/UDP-N-acetylglucosamine-1-phosphate transferase